MPAKNSVKQYVEDGAYHIYNRGVAKGNIFLDGRDYKTLLFYLRVYLTDPEILKAELQGSDPSGIDRRNFAEKIALLAYCLMPNHLHFLARQKEVNAITEFMRCVMTNYVMYFNKRYDRVGPLFQGKFKAVLVDKDSYLLHLSRYIHLNPIIQGSDPSNSNKGLVKEAKDYGFSSYAEYLGQRNTKWTKQEFILGILDNNARSKKGKQNSYQEFVEDYTDDSREVLGNLTLE